MFPIANKQDKLWEIAVHILIWCVVLLFPLLSIATTNKNLLIEGIFFIFWIPIVFMGALFYLNYNYLIDKYFYPKKKLGFIVWNWLVICLFFIYRYGLATSKYMSIMETDRKSVV